MKALTQRCAWLLAVLLILINGAPGYAAPVQQDDPAAQCAAGNQLFLDGRAAEALPLLEAGFTQREQATFADPDDLGLCALSVGVLRDGQNNHSGALDAYQVALKTFQASGNREFEGATLHNIGQIYDSQGQYVEAMRNYQQALAIHREVGDRAMEGFTLINIGLIYSAQGRSAEALSSYQQVLVISRELDDRVGEGQSLSNMGAVYHSQGRYANALDSLQQALVIFRELGDRAAEAQILSNIGSVYDDQGQYAEALASYQQALAIFRELGNRVGEGQTLSNIGSLYDNQARYAEALDSLEQALVINREVGDQAGEGDTLNNLGMIYSTQGHTAEALDTLQQALVIRREIGDQTGEAITLANIGTVYSAQGQFTQALDSLQQALALSRQIGDRAGEGDSLSGIGSVYKDLGRYAEALDSFQQALAIHRELSDRTSEGFTLTNIGAVYADQGRSTEALDTFQQALVIHRELGNRSGEGFTLTNIGVVYVNQGRSTEALDTFQQALVIHGELGNRLSGGVTLNNIGVIYLNQGRSIEALDTFQQALIIRREVGDRAGEGATLTNIGVVHYNQGEYTKALESYQQALVILREVGDQAGAGVTLHNIGEIYRSQGRLAEALDSFQQAIAIYETIRAAAGSEAGRAGFIAQHISTYQAVVELLHQQDQPEAAFFATEQGRARAFLDSLATGQVQLADDATAGLLVQEQDLYARRQALQDNLAQARAARPPAPDLVADLEAQLATVEADYAGAVAALAARDDELADLAPGRSQNVLGVSQVQRLLDEHTTLIAYFLLDDQTLAFLLTQDEFRVVPLEAGAEELAGQITLFRDFADVSAAPPDSAVRLYRWLIEPLKPHLKTAHLAIIPHGVLHYFPFAALTDGQRYLIDDYTLVTLPNASALPFILQNAGAQNDGGSGETETGPPVLILGNPTTGDFDATASLAASRGQLGSLPFAEKESKAIAKLYGVEPLLGESATESAVREKSAQAPILHLAAHGFYNPTAPLTSLIALAPDPESQIVNRQSKIVNRQSKIVNPQSMDGWLTVGEVYSLDLRQTGLVVLSACETQLGQKGLETGLGVTAGDDVVGLTRALIFAGTPSVIASLWAVEDEATARLMERFYTHLKEGLGKAEALRQAQIELREEYPNPYYWAGFVLSGDPGLVK